MILSSVKQQIISEEQKKKERGLSSRFIAQNFNDAIAKYFYKNNLRYRLLKVSFCV